MGSCGSDIGGDVAVVLVVMAVVLVNWRWCHWCLAEQLSVNQMGVEFVQQRSLKR